MPIKNIDIILVPYLAEALSNPVGRLTEYKVKALLKLRAKLKLYEARNYHEKLITAIANKKAQMILAAKSKAVIDRIIASPKPHFNGIKFVDGKYDVPEEEMICWSETSLRGPLIDAGYKRYVELFKRFFPEEAEKYFGKKDK